jgi:hypothetical protein
MATNKQITQESAGSLLEPLDRRLKENCAPESFCRELAKLFQVHVTEVALLRLEEDRLLFVFPVALRAAGSIPVSSAASIAAHTVAHKKAEFYNNFIKVKHASVFESVKLGHGEDNTPLEKPIQRLLSVPVLGGDGTVLGVIQICRKAFDLASCGPEFTVEDVATMEGAAALAAETAFMRKESASAATQNV